MMKPIFFKLAGLPILLVYVNLGFLLWAKDVFSQIQTLLPILLLNAFICADIVIRPISRKKDEYNRVVVLISFLLLPIGLIFPYYEYKILMKQILPPPISIMVMVFGIGFLLVGGILLLASRLQIGKYGGPKISIEENHRLITTGMYQHIRHPIYLGFLFLFFGYSSALGSIVTTIGITLTLFLIFKSRMEMEEDLLLVSFGEEYLTYLKRTKRLLPFLY